MLSVLTNKKYTDVLDKAVDNLSTDAARTLAIEIIKDIDKKVNTNPTNPEEKQQLNLLVKINEKHGKEIGKIDPKEIDPDRKGQNLG